MGSRSDIEIDFLAEDSIDRVQRSIVMLTGHAIGELMALGYRRPRHINVSVHPDGLPVNVTLNGEPAYVIDFAPNTGTHRLVLEGEWLFQPKRCGFWARLFRR